MTDLTDLTGLTERLREVPKGQGHSFPSTGPNGEPCHTVVPYGNMMHLAADALETLTQENVRLREAAWRDIESAPKDGTRFLAYWRGLGFGSEDTIAICSWDAPGTSCEHWTVDGRWTPGDDPTHWMPLPPAPARKALGGGDEKA